MHFACLLPIVTNGEGLAAPASDRFPPVETEAVPVREDQEK